MVTSGHGRRNATTGATAAPTLADALRQAHHRLAAAGFETPRLDAEVLLRHVLGLDRAAFFARLSDRLGPADAAAFTDLVARRLAGTPIAYLTGEREFMGLRFAVRPGVLIPRPETEALVEWALDWLASRPASTVLDVGTGPGTIALSVAALAPSGWRGLVVASDVSAAALAAAAENRDRLGLGDRVALVRGNLVDWCGGPVDLILANLPYLRPDQVAANPDLGAEPSLALLGGVSGLELILPLIADAPRILAAGGALGLEIDPAQAEPVAIAVVRALPSARIGVRPDLAGLPRHVIGETAP